MKHILAFALNHEHALVADAQVKRTDDINFDCYEPAVMHYTDVCRTFSKVSGKTRPITSCLFIEYIDSSSSLI